MWMAEINKWVHFWVNCPFKAGQKVRRCDNRGASQSAVSNMSAFSAIPGSGGQEGDGEARRSDVAHRDQLSGSF